MNNSMFVALGLCWYRSVFEVVSVGESPSQLPAPSEAKGRQDRGSHYVLLRALPLAGREGSASGITDNGLVTIIL